MDTIRTVAMEQHFWTVEFNLRDYGKALLIGDKDAVERIVKIVVEQDEHQLVRLPDPLPPA
jgi:hypothetical protein